MAMSISGDGLISRTGGTDMTGTNTNDNAAAGEIGEFIDSQLPLASAVALTTSVTANITSISLTAGDWDVSAIANFLPAGSTNITQLIGGISTTSATIDPSDNFFRHTQLNFPSFVPGASASGVPTPVVRISVATTTTIYLVARGLFTVSTLSGYGRISARRVR